MFSDKEMLRRAIETSEWQFSIYFRKTPAGKEEERRFYEEHYPLNSGYFRAYYWRSSKQESFSFSPDPNKEELVMVNLKNNNR